jgi:hypothetical protein
MQSRRSSLEIRNLGVGGFRGWLRPPYMSFPHCNIGEFSRTAISGNSKRIGDDAGVVSDNFQDCTEDISVKCSSDWPRIDFLYVTWVIIPFGKETAVNRK